MCLTLPPGEVDRKERQLRADLAESDVTARPSSRKATSLLEAARETAFGGLSVSETTPAEWRPFVSSLAPSYVPSVLSLGDCCVALDALYRRLGPKMLRTVTVGDESSLQALVWESLLEESGDVKVSSESEGLVSSGERLLCIYISLCLVLSRLVFHVHICLVAYSYVNTGR
jgi:hypothetical protein